MKKQDILRKKVERNSLSKLPKTDFLIVGIGASAGGVQALKTFFENVPTESNAAYVVILHLSPDFDSQLANILQTVAKIPITEVKEKVRVEANHVYVISPNESLSMNDGHIVVTPIQTVEERRAPVDIFFRTLAESHRARAVAVVLSGTGANGSMGIKRVKERGGAAFVQNPNEAEFGEMPRNSLATELIDEVLNVAEIPARIIEYQKNLGKIHIPVEPESREEEQQAALREIFTSLRVRTGHDFANYKRPTILRRIERRINVRRLSSLPDYAAYLKENPEEINALLKDLLISVTNFFRDKEAFQYLERDVVPRILTGKKAGEAVRIWVAGCATGEEAYSLAMLLTEQIERSPDAPTVQIFATDIDEDAIAAARSGFYTLNDAADVSPERLNRFFTKEKNGYRIRRELREMILFANHNLLKDPSFSRLDLITCRNLLIYFNGAAQERVLETFHFALKPNGFLFLGSSESIDGAGDLYAVFNREQRIFSSRPTAPRIAYPVPDLSPSLRFDQSPPDKKQKTENRPFEKISYGDLHGRILEQFAPPSIIVNVNYEVVHVSENAGRFLQIAGELSPNLFKLILPDLRLPVSTAVYQAAQKQINIVAENLPFTHDGRAETVNVSVRPVLRRINDAAYGFILIVFESAENATDATETAMTTSVAATRQLEEELLRSNSRFQTSLEHSEIQAEELKASNEELQAINEELRSATEELETGKEELQSVNEELVTVNQELKIKIEELSQSNNDLQNLIGSTNIGTIFLDRNFCIKFFTPVAAEIFNLIPADSGRLISDITHKLGNENLAADVETVLNKLQPVEREVGTSDGNFYLMQITPYRTAEDRISGTIITFVNITPRIRAERKLSESVENLERQTRIFDTTLTTITDFAYIFDRDGRFVYSNQPLLDLLNIASEEIVGKNFFDLDYPEDLAAHLQNQIRAVFDTKKLIRDETEFINPEGIHGFYEYIFNPVFAADGAVELVSGSTRDITERKRAEANLRDSEIRFRAVFEQANVGIIQLSFEGRFLMVNPGFCQIIGYREEECLKLTAAEITHPDDIKREEIETKRLLAGEIDGYTLEKRVFHKNGEIVWGTMTATLVRDEAGKPLYLLSMVEDITARKRAELDLRESQGRLHLVVESVTEYAIITTDTGGIINGWNWGAEKMFGYTAGEIIGQSAEIIFTAADRQKGVVRKELEDTVREGRAASEHLNVRKDGSEFYASCTMNLLKDNNGRHIGFVKIARDRTEKIAAEKVVREKEVLQKLVGAQEDERKRIARDLHDELGQLLTALRLQLEAVRKSCEDDQKLIGKVDEAQLTAKRVDAGIDFLAWELRPAALDDFGLYAALAKYVREWSHYSGITGELLDSKSKKARFAPEVETNLYRIAQEALNNVYKHAEAKRVEIVFDRRGDEIVLIIEDDGTGFNPEDKMNKEKGIGLIGMRERAALIGGQWEIESVLGKGTTVFVRVPASIGEKEISNDE